MQYYLAGQSALGITKLERGTKEVGRPELVLPIAVKTAATRITRTVASRSPRRASPRYQLRGASELFANLIQL